MASSAVFIVFTVMINYLALAEKREYKLGLLIPYSKVIPRFSTDFNRGANFAAAMTIAVERLNADPTLLADYNVTFVWKDTKCDELIAVHEQLNQINSGIQAFIGPGCNCQTAARNAAAFNMTMISYVSILSSPHFMHFNLNCSITLYDFYDNLSYIVVNVGFSRENQKLSFRSSLNDKNKSVCWLESVSK